MGSGLPDESTTTLVTEPISVRELVRPPELDVYSVTVPLTSTRSAGPTAVLL